MSERHHTGALAEPEPAAQPNSLREATAELSERLQDAEPDLYGANVGDLPREDDGTRAFPEREGAPETPAPEPEEQPEALTLQEPWQSDPEPEEPEPAPEPPPKPWTEVQQDAQRAQSDLAMAQQELLRHTEGARIFLARAQAAPEGSPEQQEAVAHYQQSVALAERSAQTVQVRQQVAEQAGSDLARSHQVVQERLLADYPEVKTPEGMQSFVDWVCGTYGVTAERVMAETNEMQIRMALDAYRGQRPPSQSRRRPNRSRRAKLKAVPEKPTRLTGPTSAETVSAVKNTLRAKGLI